MDCVSGCSAEIRHHSSSVGRNVLHMSFKVKYCHEIFNDLHVEKRCEEFFKKVSEAHRWILRETGFDKNHVHITIDAGTKGSEDVRKSTKRYFREKTPNGIFLFEENLLLGKWTLEPDNLFRQPW